MRTAGLCAALVCLVTMIAAGQTSTDNAPTVRACTVYGEMELLVMGSSGTSAGRNEIVVDTPTRTAGGVRYYWDTGRQTGDGSMQVLALTTVDISGPVVRFGQQGYHPVELDGQPVQVMAFQQFGEPWTFAIDGTIYVDESGTAVPIGQVDFRTYRAAGGQQQRATMSRAIGDSNWWFVTDGVVYRQAPDGSLTQAGLMEWRIVTHTGGETMVIMTRGATADDAWTGVHEGMRYVDPR